MKNELKVELKNKELLQKLIKESYYENNQNGRLSGKKEFIINEETDDVFFTVIKGLDRSTIKVTNKELIDGNIRMLIDESEGVTKVIPVSTYCINENNTYSFW